MHKEKMMIGELVMKKPLSRRKAEVIVIGLNLKNDKKVIIQAGDVCIKVNAGDLMELMKEAF